MPAQSNAIAGQPKIGGRRFRAAMVNIQAAKMIRNPMMLLMIFIGVLGSEYDTAKTTRIWRGEG